MDVILSHTRCVSLYPGIPDANWKDWFHSRTLIMVRVTLWDTRFGSEILLRFEASLAVGQRVWMVTFRIQTSDVFPAFRKTLPNAFCLA
jgi:hypothetical protein